MIARSVVPGQVPTHREPPRRRIDRARTRVLGCALRANGTARVRAQTDVRCLAIARTELERLIAERPGLGERLRQLSD